MKQSNKTSERGRIIHLNEKCEMTSITIIGLGAEVDLRLFIFLLCLNETSRFIT